MTDPFVRDDVLEAVLASRAGDAAPADLRDRILAAVATDVPRVTARRSVRHPWRLLAVAAVLLGTIGTALFVGGQRVAEVTPTPPPSYLAVIDPSPTPSRSAAPTMLPSPAETAEPLDAPPPLQSPSLEIGPLTGNCARLHASAEQAGIRPGPWVVGKRGALNAISNGLIAADDGIGSNTLRLVDPRTGKKTKIPVFDADRLSIVGWSPTGSALAFDAVFGTGGIGTCVGLFVWSETGIVDVTYQRGCCASATWSPTGSSLTFLAGGSDGTLHLFMAGFDGSVRDLSSPCGSDCDGMDTPIWSPDGARIAVSWLTADQNDSRLSLLDVQTGEWSLVPHSEGVRLNEPFGNDSNDWLDASTLLVQADVMSTTGHPGYATVAVDKPGMPMTRVAWPRNDAGAISPDLKWATDLGCGRCVVTLRSRATGRTRTIWDSTAVNEWWSPDSKQMVVSVGKSVAKPGLWVINVDGTGLHRVTSTIPTSVAWQPVWP